MGRESGSRRPGPARRPRTQTCLVLSPSRVSFARWGSRPARSHKAPECHSRSVNRGVHESQPRPPDWGCSRQVSGPASDGGLAARRGGPFCPRLGFTVPGRRHLLEGQGRGWNSHTLGRCLTSPISRMFRQAEVPDTGHPENPGAALTLLLSVPRAFVLGKTVPLLLLHGTPGPSAPATGSGKPWFFISGQGARPRTI